MSDFMYAPHVRTYEYASLKHVGTYHIVKHGTLIPWTIHASVYKYYHQSRYGVSVISSRFQQGPVWNWRAISVPL